MITTWYLQSQRTWDKLCHSCIGSSFLPRGAFPEGRAYAVSRRLHAGSLEALRVSRPEAVVLVGNKVPAIASVRLRQQWTGDRNQACDHPFSWVLGAAQRHDDSLKTRRCRSRPGTARRMRSSPWPGKTLKDQKALGTKLPSKVAVR